MGQNNKNIKSGSLKQKVSEKEPAEDNEIDKKDVNNAKLAHNQKKADNSVELSNSFKQHEERGMVGGVDLSLPDKPLSVAQFRGQIVSLRSESVVPFFIKLHKAKLIENPRATAIELQRLGYSVELEKYKIRINKK